MLWLLSQTWYSSLFKAMSSKRVLKANGKVENLFFQSVSCLFSGCSYACVFIWAWGFGFSDSCVLCCPCFPYCISTPAPYSPSATPRPCVSPPSQNLSSLVFTVVCRIRSLLLNPWFLLPLDFSSFLFSCSRRLNIGCKLCGKRTATHDIDSTTST